MRNALLLITALLTVVHSFSQNSVEGNVDPQEVRYINGKPYDLFIQQKMRASTAWQGFFHQHSTWYVHFDEQNGMPHRAYGKPIAIAGSTLEEKSINFAQQSLAAFQIPSADMQLLPGDYKGKYSYVNFQQYHLGLPVLGSRYMVKFYEDQIVAFGCDVFHAIELGTLPTLNSEQAQIFSLNGISNSVLSTNCIGSLSVLPIPGVDQYRYHLVYVVMVNTISNEGIPANYETHVDANTGVVLSRRNTISHFHVPGHGKHECKRGCGGDQMLQVTASISGQIYELNPYQGAVTQGIPNVYVTVAGVDYATDESGSATISAAPGSTASVRLMGPWSRVYTANATPTMNITLADGENAINLDDFSNIKERSAFRSVQRIHDFMKTWMPSEFVGMDFQLPTNIDVAGTCNAMYNGTSINFYDIGGGCNATAVVADVCYHEYGHGINDKYYQSIGSSFNNGAMGEGYADFWAMACNNSPLLGVGFYTENENPLRRYDQDPRVYPTNISGEIHNDGQIIVGAWWDTHLLLGADMNMTMPLFVETYAGAQAAAANGNEGVAYTDVLIDLLQADDDDGDITNGTPHGNEIVQGFYIHGITLISNATLEHMPTLFASSTQVIPVVTTLNLQFPFYQYLQSVNCFYKINSGEWVSLSLDEVGNDDYSGEIPTQPAGTVIGYYFGTFDINGSIASVIPIGAHMPTSANIPYFTLVGVDVVGVQDCDQNQYFGQWQLGVIDDNATTGEWEETYPIGSYTTETAPGAIVAVDTQHTPSGEFCFITGNAPQSTSPIGTNDIDGGKTTLQSPVINMSNLIDPVVAYWRYYTNSPPGGANPGADYWQVRMSNDNGSNWTYVENNKTTDASWRRNALRVADFMTPTNQMKFQFIASDSTHLGQNLDGGSLIEAAMDDFIVYDQLIIGVDEAQSISTFSVFPNPAHDQLTLNWNAIKSESAEVKLINAQGQVAFQTSLHLAIGVHNYDLKLPELATGLYTFMLSNKRMMVERGIYIIK